MTAAYGKLLQRSQRILQRAETLVHQLQDQKTDLITLCTIADLSRFVELTRQVCGTCIAA